MKKATPKVNKYISRIKGVFDSATLRVRLERTALRTVNSDDRVDLGGWAVNRYDLVE